MLPSHPYLDFIFYCFCKKCMWSDSDRRVRCLRGRCITAMLHMRISVLPMGLEPTLSRIKSAVPQSIRLRKDKVILFSYLLFSFLHCYKFLSFFMIFEYQYCKYNIQYNVNNCSYVKYQILFCCKQVDYPTKHPC